MCTCGHVTQHLHQPLLRAPLFFSRPMLMEAQHTSLEALSHRAAANVLYPTNTFHCYRVLLAYCSNLSVCISLPTQHWGCRWVQLRLWQHLVLRSFTRACETITTNGIFRWSLWSPKSEQIDSGGSLCPSSRHFVPSEQLLFGAVRGKEAKAKGERGQLASP